MCVTIQTQGKDFICFDSEEYYKELALMRKRMAKLLEKVEQNDIDETYRKFKNSLNDNNHENLKK